MIDKLIIYVTKAKPYIDINGNVVNENERYLLHLQVRR